MADEVQLSCSMSVRKSDTQGRLLLNNQFSSQIRSDLVGFKGPLPGSVLVPLTGVSVSLSQLVTPGFCWLKHQGLASGADPGADASIYYVDYGIMSSGGVFYPWGELWPGDEFPLRLSRNLLESYNTTGTGTGPPSHAVRLMAHGAACNVWIGAFEF